MRLPPQTTRRRRSRGERARAFTILELLITILILSILAALAIPAFFSQPEVTLENASILLAKDLRIAQNRAAYMAEPSYFVFPQGGDGYHVMDSSGRIVAHPSTHEEFSRVYSVDAVFEGVEVLDIVAGEDRTITFDHRGRALESARITLGFEGDVRVVMIEKGAGNVAILGSTTDWTDDLF